MNIVLVGGGGFIGHTLALRLKEQGHEVSIIDALSVNNLYTVENEQHLGFIHERLALIKDIPLLRLDARDYDLLSSTMKSLKPDVIVHLAAIAHLDRANKNPFNTFDHSLRTLENTLDVANNLDVGRVVFFSSSTVYGDFPSETVTEETPCNPRGIYGSLKLAGELLVKAYKEACDLDYVIVRPSALYGPRCVSGRVIQKFIELARAGEPIQMRGDEALDFTYIEDLVQGVMLCIEKDEALNETFNITYGEARKVSEVVELLDFDDLRVDRAGVDRERPSRGTLSVQKARDLLGYSPQWPIEDGVTEYMAWYGRQLSRKA